MCVLPLQREEEIACKSARLQRLGAAAAAAQREAAALAAECQGEREHLQGNLRQLSAHMRPKVPGAGADGLMCVGGGWGEELSQPPRMRPPATTRQRPPASDSERCPRLPTRLGNLARWVGRGWSCGMRETSDVIDPAVCRRLRLKPHLGAAQGPARGRERGRGQPA